MYFGGLLKYDGMILDNCEYLEIFDMSSLMSLIAGLVQEGHLHIVPLSLCFDPPSKVEYSGQQNPMPGIANESEQTVLTLCLLAHFPQPSTPR